MDIYYNGVQLYDRLFKDVMRDLEPFNLEYYVSEPFMYLTSSGVLIYISNQYSTLEKPDPDWNSIEWLLHCPVEGAAIDSGFLNTQNPSPDWWYLFDTSKETWYDCEPAKKKKDDDR